MRPLTLWERLSFRFWEMVNEFVCRFRGHAWIGEFSYTQPPYCERCGVYWK